jgi:hypothetical protein
VLACLSQKSNKYKANYKHNPRQDCVGKREPDVAPDELSVHDLRLFPREPEPLAEPSPQMRIKPNQGDDRDHENDREKCKRTDHPSSTTGVKLPHAVQNAP